VPASHVTGWADSLLEFGYHPPSAAPTPKPAAPTREEIELRKRHKVLESLLECLG
jgi:hypothetical protein